MIDPELMEMAEEGDPEAQCMVATSYLSGKRPNWNHAVKWLRKAARAGFVPAQYSLAFLYNQGKHVERSPQLFLKWLERAAEQGDDYAQVALGYRYATGDGVRQDIPRAVHWYR